jgi:hypothetical protein
MYDLDGNWPHFVKAVSHFAYQHRSTIIHHAITIGAGFGAGMMAGAICAGTAGVGCVIMAGAVFGASFNVVGQASASYSLHERVRVRSYYKWMGQGALGGASTSYAKELPKQRVWLPARLKIIRHHWPTIRSRLW